MAKHSEYIDRLKGVAIVLMVIGHIYLFCYENHDMMFLKIINTINMPLFMFLSGLVISANLGYEKLGKRIIRYMAPSIVIGFVTALMIHGCSGMKELLEMLIVHLTIPSSGYWYLVALTIFNLTLLFYKINRKNKIILDIIISAGVYLGFLLSWKWGGYFGQSLCMEHCTCFYPFFISGHLVNKYQLFKKIFSSNQLFSLSLILIGLLLYIQTNIHIVDNLIGRFILPFCGIVTMVYTFFHREDKNTAIEKGLAYLGKNSLDIYIWHPVILSVIHLQMIMDWFIATNNIFIEILLTVIISVIMSVCCVCFGKFIKQSAWVRHIAYGEITFKC